MFKPGLMNPYNPLTYLYDMPMNYILQKRFLNKVYRNYGLADQKAVFGLLMAKAAIAHVNSQAFRKLIKFFETDCTASHVSSVSYSMQAKYRWETTNLSIERQLSTEMLFIVECGYKYQQGRPENLDSYIRDAAFGGYTAKQAYTLINVINFANFGLERYKLLFDSRLNPEQMAELSNLINYDKNKEDILTSCALMILQSDK